MNIPKNFQIAYSEDEISETVQRLGAQISGWAEKVWEDSHTDIVAVPVLRGGIFFFADLVRSVKCSLEIAPAKAWGYVNMVNAEMLEEVKVDISSVPAKGRRVLLIDDICDSGRTMEVLQKHFMEEGALEVRSTVLIRRNTEENSFDPGHRGDGVIHGRTFNFTCREFDIGIRYSALNFIDAEVACFHFLRV